MFDINIKNIKRGRRLYSIFLAFGLFFLFVLGVTIISAIIKLNSLDSTVQSKRVEINSYIDNGNKVYTPIYYYEVNSEVYSCSSNSSSTNKIKPQNKIIYYDSKKPSNCITEYSKSNNNAIIIFIIIPIIFITVAVVNIIKINKRIKVILELNQNGKLIKNLPYRLEYTNISVNKVPIQRPVVDYTLSSGKQITLYGDPRHDRKHYDEDGRVDLLIDENNPDNYYIDFEINRLSGNLQQDYYQK